MILFLDLTHSNRDTFSPDIPHNEVPAHRFLSSINNIVIERGWFRFRVQWGDNLVEFWLAGHGIFNHNDPNHLYESFASVFIAFMSFLSVNLFSGYGLP